MILGYRDRRTGQFASGAFVRAFQGLQQHAATRLSIVDGKPWLAARRLAESAVALTARGCTWAPFRKLRCSPRRGSRPVSRQPDARDRRRPGIGSRLVPGTPLPCGTVPRAAPARAPRLSEHTAEVLRRAGFAEGGIGGSPQSIPLSESNASLPQSLPAAFRFFFLPVSFTSPLWVSENPMASRDRCFRRVTPPCAIEPSARSATVS